MSRLNLKNITFGTLILLSGTTYSNKAPNIEKMKSEIKKIDSKIAQKSDRIKLIGSEKLSLEKEIEKNAKEIEEIKKDREKILDEIRRVERNIDYGVKNLSITSAERERILKDNIAKINVWNRHGIWKNSEEIPSEIKYSFRKLLQDNYQKMERIENIDSNIKSAKKDVEQEKRTLENLRNQATASSKKLDIKISEQERLIKKLNSEKVTHESDIKKLQNEKNRIEKEIEKIIAARTKVVKNVSYAQAQKSVGKLSKPLAGKTVVKFNQKKNGIVINGVEIRGELGAQIKSSAAGKVIYSDDFQGLGKVVMIDYGYNLIGVYGNLISTEVRVGSSVKRRQSVGVLGFSNDGQPDLYYELRFKLKPVNPELFF